MDEFVTANGWRVDPASITWTSTRSGGPGGQHANTSDTAVTVTLHLATSGLPEPIRRRLRAVEGDVVIGRSADTRSQWRNRRLAWERIAERIDRAAKPPVVRRATRPSRRAIADRLDGKRRRSEVKRDRRRPGREDG